MTRLKTLSINLTLCLALALASAAVGAPSVVASLKPVHALVSGVMGDVGVPSLLLSGDESPHGFQLRPSQTRQVLDADLLVWIGPEMETPLARLLKTAESTRSLVLLDTPGLRLLRFENPPADDGHGHGHDAHDHGEAAIDPHAWLDPENAMAMVREIAKVLASLDPENAVRYEANAEATIARLQALDERLAGAMADVDGRHAVFHDAFRYFETAYGLDRAAVVTLSPEQTPGAAHLRSVRQTLRDQRIMCLFSEPQFPSRLVRVVGEGLPIRHAVIDPIGIDIEPGPEAYEILLDRMARSYIDCLGDPPR
jgi:zinc transport system substrate-binding protein